MSMTQLIYDYKNALHKIKNAYQAADPQVDKPVIGGMINDLDYAIEWMRSGGDPNKQRGADRVEVYLTDPEIIDSRMFDNMVTDGQISQADRQRIDMMLQSLTEREEDIFIMHFAELLSFDEIAVLLKVKKATVATTCRRAQRKIKKLLKKGDPQK